MPVEEEDSGPIDFVEGAGGDPIKARSANIYADPKMRELKHYMVSHQHESRLREAANLEKRTPNSRSGIKALRAEGCEVMDAQMKKLSKGEPVVPYAAKASTLPDRFRDKSQEKEELKATIESRLAELRRTDSFQTRLTWRSAMDHSLKRLLIDMELSRDERLKEYQVKNQASMEAPAKQEEKDVQTRFAKARCEHLDHVYSWYVAHGMKEARKERKAPPYLRYDPQKPVMPGSRRVAPMLHRHTRPGKPNESGVEHSSSSPALISAGTAVGAQPDGA